MNIQETKTHLSRLVEKAAAGEEIIIAKAGKPMAKLVPYIPPIAPRTGGFLAGEIWETQDAWEPDREMTEGALFPAAKGSISRVEKDEVLPPPSPS